MKTITLFKTAFLAFMLVFAGNALALSDSALSKNVTSALSADSSLSGTTITATAANGTVTLSGNVESDTQANTATQIAQSVVGVKDVNTTNLMVNGSQHPVADALITAKVNGVFLQKKLFGNVDVAAITIKVETNNGIVSLSGTADNQRQIDNAINIAKSIAGVKDVHSTITLNSTN
jgi:hyperosmotically inducible protein